MRIAFALSLAVTVVVGCARTRWVQVNPDGGEFVVSMPAQPTKEQKSKDFEFGRLTWVNYNANDGETSFMVSYVDYPDAIMDNLTTDRILASGIERMMSLSPSARKTKDFVGEFQGYLSRDFVVVHPAFGLTSIGKQILADRRQYLLQVNTPTKQLKSGVNRRFMNSFKVHKQPSGARRITPELLTKGESP